MNLFHTVSDSLFAPSDVHFGCLTGLVSLQLNNIIYCFSSSDHVILFASLFLPYWGHVILFSWMCQRLSTLFSDSYMKAFTEFGPFSESLSWQIPFSLFINTCSLPPCSLFFCLFILKGRKIPWVAFVLAVPFVWNVLPFLWLLLLFRSPLKCPLKAFLWPPL